MTQSIRSVSDDCFNTGDALVIGKVVLENGKTYSVTIEKGTPVPEDFAFLKDYLRELREACCVQVGNELLRKGLDPARVQVVHCEGKGTLAVSDETEAEEFDLNSPMYHACQRICRITESRFTAVSSSQVEWVRPQPVQLASPTPSSVHQPAPSSAAPSPQQRDAVRDAVMALLDPLKNPKGDSFQEVRQDPNHPLREDLKKLLRDPADTSAYETRQWLLGLTQHLYNKCFTDGEEAQRKRMSALWVIALLNQPGIALGNLVKSLSEEVGNESSHCGIM